MCCKCPTIIQYVSDSILLLWFTGVFFHIIPIPRKQGIKHFIQPDNIHILCIIGNCFGQASHNHILLEPLHSRKMQRSRQGHVFYTISHQFLPHGTKELHESTWMQSHIFYTTDRKRDMSAHKTFQQRTCCYHIDFRMLLVEVAQSLHGFWLILYLINKDQGPFTEI